MIASPARLPLHRLLAVALGLLLLGSVLARASAATPLPFDAAQRDARDIVTLITDAVGAHDPIHPSLGPTLALYAQNTGTAPSLHEGFEAAARRILAGTPAPRLTPDATSRRLNALADSLLDSLRTIEGTRADLQPADYAASALQLRAAALLARYHARRIIAAVHYSLFLRGQRLAELYAATVDTKASLEIWRELSVLLGERTTLTFGTPPVSLRGNWRAELNRLEFDYKDLEAMCCPPDESWVREKVWTPAP